MENNKITETGPQSYKQIQDTLNKFLTVDQRKEWINLNLSNLQTYNVDTTIGNNGVFVNKDTERLFRDVMFIRKYGDKEFDNTTSPQERDRRYVQDRQQEMSASYGLDKVNRNTYGFPVSYDKSKEISTNVAELKKVSPDSLRSLSESNTGLTPSMSEEEKEINSVIQNRYINDWDGSLMEDDIETLKREAPNLSNYYKEYINGNNPYIKEEDIDWETLAQEIIPQLELENYSKAENIFNRELMRIMSENQSRGEKIGNWSKRFIANVGFVIPEIAGMLSGIPEAVITDLLIPTIKGEDINWSDALATATYDSYLDNLVYKWGEQLRENNPIYTGTPEGPLLDPESAAFMAKLAIPMKGVSLLKGVSTVGKTGNALRKANRINKLTGYNRNLRKAERNFKEVIGDASSAQGDRLRNTILKAQGEGKTYSDAVRTAQEALADVYQAGSIQKGQIMLASYMESRAEAKMAQEASKQKFDNTWDKQVRDLTQQALEGDVDLDDVSYNLEVAENYRDQLMEEGYLDEIIKHMKSHPEASNYTDEQIEKAALQYLEEEATIRAKVDYYANSSKEEFDKLKDKNANMAGLVTLIENYLLLRLTEGLGGWTTKLSPYKQVSATLREQKKGLVQNTKEFLGGVRTLGSTESQLLSRMAFDETGHLKRVVTPKSVVQTLGQTGGVFAVENFQELGQELISSGTEGTSVHNAENFVLSHIAGPGNNLVNEAHQSQWLSFFQHAGFDRSAEDYMRIIKATTLQMTTGVPSVMKYSNKFSRVRTADGKTHLQDNIIRGGFENKWSYLWRQMESWVPVNSPFLHNISEITATNTDVNTFISTYNKLLDDSRRMGGFASSSLNYSISALQAALDNDETSYDHSLFAARTAESIFLAMAQNENKNRASLLYYQNLADINTKRDGESNEDFEKRKQNTLQQIRESSQNNSVKNADDEALINWAEETGKSMLTSVDNMSKRMKQLYEEYDGNISWEHMYATLYNNALYDYTKEKLDTLNIVFKNALNTIKNTEITEDDVKNNKGKKIYNEQELLMLSPMQRYGIMQKATGKQEKIVKSLKNQLAQYAADNNITIDIEATLENTMKEDRLLQEAAQEKRALLIHPNEFLNRIRNKKQRIAAGRYFELIKNVILEGDSRSDADTRADISDALNGLASNGELFGLVMNAVQTLPGAATIVQEVLEADLINDMALGGAVELLTNEEKAKGIDNTELYKRIVEKIRNSHVSFQKIKQDGWNTYVERGLLKEFDSDEEQQAWESIMNRIDEAAKVTPRVEVSDDASAKLDELDTFEEDEESLYTEEELKDLRRIELKNSTRMYASEQLNKLYLNETDEKRQLRDILNTFLDELDYSSYENLYNTLTKAIETATASNETIYNEAAKSILKDILNNLKNTLGESTDIRLPYIRLANPSFFIREHPNSAYAKFFMKYNILELLKGGKLLGKKVYVVWDKDFNNSIKEDLEGQNIPPQMRHVGLVAVVKGVIEGYEDNKITIDGEDYTRIGLFRAYGTGRHISSKDTVSYLISSSLGIPFRENDDIPDHETFLLKDTFVIEGIDEPIMRSTIHENAENPARRSLKSLIEERVKSDLSMEPESSKDPKNIAKRTIQWFLDHIKVHRKTGDNDITQAYIEDKRNNSKGKISIPIQTRNVSETPFEFTSEGQVVQTTIGDVLKEIKELLLNPNVDEQYVSSKYDSLINSFPLFLKWHTILRVLFDGKGKILNSFMERWATEENKEALLGELNEKFKSILNDKRGDTLYNRLTIPAYYKYYITYIQTDDDGTGHFAIGVKHESNPYLYQGNIVFAHYSPIDQNDFFVRGDLNVFPILNNFDVLKALVELILDEKGEVRKSNEKDEFVKWQLNYDDIENRKGSADQLLADLLSVDALTIKTESLVNYPIEVKLLPENVSIQSVSRTSRNAATEETKQTEEESISSRIANTLGIAKYDSNNSYSKIEGLGVEKGYFVEENCILTPEGIDNEGDGIKLDFIIVTPTGRVRLKCSNEKDIPLAEEYLLEQGVNKDSIEFRRQETEDSTTEDSSKSNETTESKEDNTSKTDKENFIKTLQGYVDAGSFNMVENLLREMRNSKDVNIEGIPEYDDSIKTKIEFLAEHIREGQYDNALNHLEDMEYDDIIRCCLK